MQTDNQADMSLVAHVDASTRKEVKENELILDQEEVRDRGPSLTTAVSVTHSEAVYRKNLNRLTCNSKTNVAEETDITGGLVDHIGKLL